MLRITPENITNLKPNEIFVFGSNTSGRHGAGAARLAHVKWGAVYGVAEGLTGQTYALPTVNTTITDKLSIQQIKVYVDKFITFAKANTQYTFFVTKIGCGLAGWEIKDIAPLFVEAKVVDNIYLPIEFHTY